VKTTVKAILLVVLFLCAIGSTALAAQAEWRDQNYDFGGAKFILVMPSTFSYDGYDVSDRNKFNRYPYAPEKISDMLQGKTRELTQYRIVDLEYVLSQIKANSPVTESFDPASPGFLAMVQREMGKYVDLVLYLAVRDYGWYYVYHDEYRTTENYTERVYFNRRNSDGKEVSGWEDVPRTRRVYHPAGYNISDCAEAAFRLYDAKANRDVWKYSDTRTRTSPQLSNGYDPSGPESMMKRIFDDAFKKIPLAH
jgi:hypothetical protein